MKKRIFCLLFALLMILALTPAVYGEEDAPAAEPAADTPFLISVADGGGRRLEPTEKGYLLLPEDSTSYYTVEIPPYAERNLILTVTGCHGLSTATLSFSEDGENYRSTSARTLHLRSTEETTSYLVELPEDMAVTHVRIRLGGAPGSHMYLTSLEPPLAYTEYRSGTVGSVTSVSLVGGNTLSVKGTLKDEASIRYLSYQLVLFALEPGQTAADITEDTPRLETLSVRQKFDFRVRLGEDAGNRKYLVALVSGTDILPIGSPFYAHEAVSSAKEKKYKGVYTDGRTDLFGVGAETTLVEFDLGKILLPEGSQANSRLYIIDGSYYYLNMDYMRSIRTTVDLSNACGITTVLHLTGFSALTETIPAPTVLRAFVTFLSEEYEPGSVQGVLLDDEGLDFCGDGEGLRAYATNLHLLKLLLDSRMEDVAVYGSIPCDNNVSASCAQLSAALYREGTLPYGIYFCADVMEGVTVSRIAELLTNASGASPSFAGVLWDVQTREELVLYPIYASQAASSFDAFTVRIDGVVDGGHAAAQIRAFDATHRYTEAMEIANYTSISPTGTYVLEEFDRNVATSYWHTGTGVQSFGTGYSALFGKKVLLLHLEESADRALAVYTPATALDLSSAPYVRLSFSVLAEGWSSLLSEVPTHVSGELAFVSGSRRIVLPLAEIPVGEPLEVCAYLPADSARDGIEAIVLSLDAAGASEICVESITLYSTTLTDGEISSAIRTTRTEGGTAGGEQPPVFLFIGMLSLVTIAVPILLLRRHGETVKE